MNNAANWSNLTTGAYCYLNNLASNNQTFGKLYNWFAVSDFRKLAPSGWHITSVNEWVTLFNYLGGSSVAGGKMKSARTTLWYSPNLGATNSSGFTGCPGGACTGSGNFTVTRYYGWFWSSDSLPWNEGSYTLLFYNWESVAQENTDRRTGNSDNGGTLTWWGALTG